MAFLCKTDLIRQHSGHHAGNAIDQDHSGQLAAGKDIIPNGDLLVYKGLDRPLVHPLVMPA